MGPLEVLILLLFVAAIYGIVRVVASIFAKAMVRGTRKAEETDR